MIYVDVSEARDVSRLHPKLMQTAHKVVGLENATGADILVSTVDGVLPGNVNRPPGSILLPRYIENGMLIQRKTGSDALNSITKMHNLIARMRAANSKMCWLLVTGYLFRIPDTNKVICEGRKTEWHWNAWQAALDAWQILGGYVHIEPDDLTAVNWILRWDEKLPMLLEEQKQGLAEKPMTPKLGMIDPHPERATLMTFPGCGDVTSMKIMEEYPTLASALEWMSQPTSFGIPGVGEGTLEGWHRWLGLKEGEVISVHVQAKNDQRQDGSDSIQSGSDSNESRSNTVDKGKTSGKRTDFDGSTTIPERQPRANRYKDD